MINIPYPNQQVLDNFFEIQKIEIIKRIKAIKSQNSIKIKKKKYRVTKHITYILDEFIDESKLKILLLAKPNELIEIIKKYEANLNFKKARFTKEALHKILYRVFFEYGYDKIDKLEFIKNINLGSCPYCNRNYVFITSKNGSIKPEIDHFYPKSIYPYLACSYFNLIPSCPTCNGFGAKEAKDTFYVYPISNPYTIKPIDFQFSITPHKVDFIDDVKKEQYDFNHFEIDVYGNQANLEVFHLEELYKQHKDIVLELLIKKAYYPESYIKELEKSFGFSKDEIYRYLFTNYSQEQDLHKRPLAKLTKDIAKELGLI